VAARYLHGESQYTIAKTIGVTQQQISLDLKIVRNEWRQSAIRDFDEATGEQLAKIDAVEAEAWASWELSKQSREITVTEAIEGERESRKASVRREGQVGDPRFLERIQKCIEQRCVLLRLTAPPSTVVNVQVNTKESLREAFSRAYGLEALPSPDAG
jgi:hypothetical protein